MKKTKTNQKSESNLKLSEIECILKYTFRNVNFVKEALTRQSAITERHINASTRNYQRLEFFGDSVLGLIISDLIYELFPDKKEEDLHPLRSFIVRNETLSAYAEKLDMGKFLIVGKGEEFANNIRKNKKVLADIVESLIGAVFIDSERNYDTTKYVVLNFLKPIIYNDKIYLEYADDLNKYYEKLQKRKNTLHDLSEVIYLESSQSHIVDSSFSDLLNNNTVPVHNEKKLVNNYKKSKISHIKHFDFQAFEDIITAPSDSIEAKIEKVSENLQSIPFIENDMSLVNSDTNFKKLIYNDLKNTETLVKILSNNILTAYNSFEYKHHFFNSRLLLYIMTNLGPEIPDFYSTSVLCVLHNGISEFYRKNYPSSKQYIEKAQDILKFIETAGVKEPNKLLEYRFTCVNYLAELAFINKDSEALSECIEIINNLDNNPSDTMRVVQTQKIIIKNHILKNKSNIGDLVDKFSLQLTKLNEEIKSSKLYLEDYLNIKLIKFHNSNQNNLSEILEIETIIEERHGINNPLSILVHQAHLERLKTEYELSKNKTFSQVEDMAKIAQRMIEIVCKNFTFNSPIFTESLQLYNSIINLYS